VKISKEEGMLCQSYLYTCRCKMTVLNPGWVWINLCSQKRFNSQIKYLQFK